MIVKKILEYFTVVIALWGAILSTFNYLDTKSSQEAKFFVQVDATPQGKLKRGKYVGEILISITNIGKTTATIAPELNVVIPDPLNNTSYYVKAFFNTDEIQNNEKFGSPQTKTLKAGESAIAKTYKLDSGMPFNPMQFISIIFQTTDEDTFLASYAFNDKFALKINESTNEYIGWSSSSVAEKI